MDPRPLPRPNALTAPYWEACQRGELTVQRCRHCGGRVHLPEPACPHCGGTDLPYEPVSGRGTVHTFSIVHRAFVPGFTTPYVIAWIDLEEGVRAFGGIVGGIPPEDVWIGMPVRVRFDDLPGLGRIPNWRPA
jgi:uncharacterized OB-fold protein